MNELIGPSKRSIIGVIFQSFFAIGIVLFSLMAYYFQHWWQLITFSTILGIPMMICAHLLLPESPRWLQNQGKFKEAMETLKKIATGNNKRWDIKLLEESSDEDSEDEIEIRMQPHLPPKSSDSIKDFYKNKYLATITAIQIFSWMTNSLTYYALTIGAGGDGKDLYFGTALSGLIELPAYAVSVITLRYYGNFMF